MLLHKLRQEVVTHGRKLVAARLTTGTGGNLSLLDRNRGLFAISPSAMEYHRIRPQDVVVLDLDGRVVEGQRKPSSELGFHLALYAKRPDVNAIVHTHSIYATTFACLHEEIPAVHYLIGFCGTRVPLAPYATFGSEALARNVAEAIGGANAVLLANHGLVSVGQDLPKAFAVAEEIEMVARIYYQARCIGSPRILSDEEMAEVIEKFKTYAPSQPYRPPSPVEDT
jgi:L-fuculose-phosphate aldolase